MTHHKWVQWGCECVERVLPVYEACLANVPHVGVLTAVRIWLFGPTQEEANRVNWVHPAKALAAVRRWLANPNPDNAEAAKRFLNYAFSPELKDMRFEFIEAAVLYLIHSITNRFYAYHAANAARQVFDADAAVEEEKWQTTRLLLIHHKGEEDSGEEDSGEEDNVRQ
jgi:spermidine/putrescine-binding protein